MKMTFKFSLLVFFLANIVFLSSCEENLQVSCDDFSVSISYDIDSSFVTLTADPEGGENPITYLWSTGETTQDIEVTQIMTYSVTATDADDCTASLDFVVDSINIVITEPCDNFYVVIEEIAVPAISVITAQVFGATGATTFLWSNGATTQSIEVGPGTYTVIVTDEAGCTFTSTYTVIQNSPCDSVFAIILEDIGTVTSFLTAEFADGGAVATYLWSTGEINETIEVGPGTYTVTLTDFLDCQAVADYTVTQSDPCNNLITSITVETNPANGDTLLVGNVFGGTAPYTYEWQLNGVVIDFTESIIPLINGFYTLIVTDANGCTTSTTIEYNNSNNDPCFGFEVNIIASPDSSSNLVTLFAEVSNGGTGTTYSWSSGQNTQVIVAESNSGGYGVTVTNVDGCEDEDYIQI